MYISPGVSNTCLFAPAPYYKLNKGFSARWATPTLPFKQESLGKVSFIYYLWSAILLFAHKRPDFLARQLFCVVLYFSTRYLRSIGQRLTQKKRL